MMMGGGQEKFADAKTRLRQGIKTMGDLILAVGKGDLFKELSWFVTSKLQVHCCFELLKSPGLLP